MTFLEQFERDFNRQLDDLNYGRTDEASFLRWASAKILESYRNGLTGVAVKHLSEVRRGGFVWTLEMRKHHGEAVRRGIAFKRQFSEKA